MSERIGQAKIDKAVYGRTSIGGPMRNKDRIRLAADGVRDRTEGSIKRTRKERDQEPSLRDTILKIWNKVNFSRDAKGSSKAKSDTMSGKYER
jgi:hypothetical protein